MRSISIVLLAGVLAVSSCHGKPTVERAGSRPGTPGVAGQPVDPSVVVAPGIIEPWGGEVRLSSRESGWIAEVPATEGQQVGENQLLLRLDDAVQRRAVEEARAEAAEASEVLRKLQRGATDEEIREAAAMAAAAAEEARQAAADSLRASRLLATQAIAATEHERSVTRARTTRGLADAAAARLAAVRRGPRPEEVSAAELRLAAARARLASAQAALERRWVVAPAPGTILWSRYKPGEFYSTGAEPLMILGDLSRLRVRVEVDEIDAAWIRVGARAALYSDGGARLAEGRVIRKAPSVGRRALESERPTDRQDLRVQEVFLEVGPAGLVPGQRVWAHIPASGTGRTSRGRQTNPGA